MTLLNDIEGNYALPLNSLIKAKVSATNLQGDGDYSTENSVGILI